MSLLLLVDDHPLFCDGFAAMIRALRPAWQLQVANSVTEAITVTQHRRPDLIILDAMLPDGDGFNLGSLLRSRGIDSPRVVVSSRDDAVNRTRALASGAKGLIGKAAGPDEIIAALEVALSGRSLSNAVSLVTVPSLTPRQAAVLELLAAGLSNKQICYRLDIAERTVRAHLTDLFQLLGAHSRTQAIIRARDLGLLNAS